MAVDLMTEPSGAILPVGNVTVGVKPAVRGPIRAVYDRIRIDAVPLSKTVSHAAAAARTSPTSPASASSVSPVAREYAYIQQAEPPQMQHHLRHAAGQETHGTVG